MKHVNLVLNVFEDNSSTRDALLDFARGTIPSLAGLKRASWPHVCKLAVDNTLRPMGVAKARMAVKRWAWKNGYSVRKTCDC